MNPECGWRYRPTSSVKAGALRLRRARRMRSAESRTGHFPLVVTDVRMPDGNGLQLMRTVRSSHPSTAVIVLTAFGNVPEAVKAIQDGACDYLTKPISFEQLQTSVSRVMQHVKNAAVPTRDREKRDCRNGTCFIAGPGSCPPRCPHERRRPD